VKVATKRKKTDLTHPSSDRPISQLTNQSIYSAIYRA